MATKLKVTRIMLTRRGGDEVELTIDEARDLYNQLAELFAPKLAPLAPIVIEREVLPQPWRLYYPHWISSPGSADYPQELPYVTCQAPSGLHTRYMGEVVDATNAA